MQKSHLKLSLIRCGSWTILGLASSFAMANSTLNNLSGFDPSCLETLGAFEECVKRGDLTGYTPEKIDAFREMARKNEIQKRANEINIKKQEEEAAKRKWAGGINLDTLSESRCAEDSLNAAQARGRAQWVKKCFAHLLSSDIKAKITENEAKDRPLYPIVSKKNGSEFIETIPVPTDPNASCDSLQPDMYIKGFCTSGCFAPEQPISFVEGIDPIGNFNEAFGWSLLVLGPNSTIENPVMIPNPISMFTKTERDIEEPILDIKTQTGKLVSVTLNHPMMMASGEFKSAKDLVVGESLATITEHLAVNSKGIIPDKIAEIKSRKYFGKVYNFLTDSQSLAENVVISDGVVTGNLRIQNMEAAKLNKVIFRQNLDSEMLDVIALSKQ